MTTFETARREQNASKNSDFEHENSRKKYGIYIYDDI